VKQKTLLGIPIFNEEKLLEKTLDSLYNVVKEHNIDILAYNDGSTDFTSKILREKQGLWGDRLIVNNHVSSKGYGKTIIDILKYGCNNKEKYEFLITFDADLQHDPKTIPYLLKELKNNNHVDVVSCSRYLSLDLVNIAKDVPVDRFLINMNITKLLNTFYKLNLTDAFSGFRGYRVCRVESMFKMRDVGYSSPIEFWINIAFHNLLVSEVPTSLIYLKGRESKGNEIPWRDRLDNYLNAFRNYAWEDKQKENIEKLAPKLYKFIENQIEVHYQAKVGIISPYENFWANCYINKTEFKKQLIQITESL
jgi:glycosyltransferase involved in cell wall biosynthesis